MGDLLTGVPALSFVTATPGSGVTEHLRLFERPSCRLVGITIMENALRNQTAVPLAPMCSGDEQLTGFAEEEMGPLRSHILWVSSADSKLQTIPLISRASSSQRQPNSHHNGARDVPLPAILGEAPSGSPSEGSLRVPSKGAPQRG